MNNPFFFQNQEALAYFNMQPSSVKGKANRGVEYYKRILYTKLYSVFEFTLPKAWKPNWFRFWLFHFGSIGVVYTKKYGWTCQPYGIERLDLYYNPAVIRVCNSYLDKPYIGFVGYNAGVLHLMDDYFGLDDIVTRYAEQLAELDKDININLMNCNVSYVAQVSNKKEADEMKEAYGRATTGEPFITLNKDLIGDGIKPFFNNTSGNFIADKLHQTRRDIINAFLTEIGIRNSNLEKRERLNSQEVGENNDETRAIVSIILDNLKKDMEALNAISGLSLDVKLRYNYEVVGGSDNE